MRTSRSSSGWCWYDLPRRHPAPVLPSIGHCCWCALLRACSWLLRASGRRAVAAVAARWGCGAPAVYAYTARLLLLLQLQYSLPHTKSHSPPVKHRSDPFPPSEFLYMVLRYDF